MPRNAPSWKFEWIPLAVDACIPIPCIRILILLSGVGEPRVVMMMMTVCDDDDDDDDDNDNDDDDSKYKNTAAA